MPIELHGCGWTTVSLSAREIGATQERALAAHPGRAVVVSCQRLEAFSDKPCACDAPEKWAGEAAVARIAEVAAWLHSAVLGEDQIMGQVRAAFSGASPAVRHFADMDHPRPFRSKVNECPVGFDPYYLTCDNCLGLKFFPFVCKRLDHGQFDAVALNPTNPYIYRIPFLQNILNFIDYELHTINGRSQ